MNDPTIPTYLSHSYRSDDQELNQGETGLLPELHHVGGSSFPRPPMSKAGASRFRKGLAEKQTLINQ